MTIDWDFVTLNS